MSITVNPSQFGFLQPQGRAGDAVSNQASATNKTVTEPVAQELLKTARQSPQRTADNMLDFIGRGVDSLRASGASTERVADRIAAAREGVARGYAEAEEIIEARGLMTDELRQEIAAGRKLVEEGINQIERGEKNSTDTRQLNEITSTSSLKVANSLTLDVMTRDGDSVTVSFSQSEQRRSESAPDFLQVSSSNRSAWTFEVEGNLDEAEQEALSNLFNSVQDLSERFFSGDLGSALEQAMSLGFDGNELASLSLNLTQQTVMTSTRAYSQVQPQLPTEQLEALKAPLASYIDAYTRAIEQADALAKPEKTLQDLMNSLLPEEERLPIWNQFQQGLEAAGKLSGLLSGNES